MESTYRVDAADELATRTATAICERLRALKARGVQVRALDAGRIRVVSREDARSIATADFVARPVSFHFYDWEPNVLGGRGPDRPSPGSRALYDAAVVASRSKPRAEATDVPPDGPSDEVVRRFGGDRSKVNAYYDRRNDTRGTAYYVFGHDRRPLRSDGKALPPGSLPRLAARPTAPSRDEVPAGGTGGPGPTGGARRPGGVPA